MRFETGLAVGLVAIVAIPLATFVFVEWNRDASTAELPGEEQMVVEALKKLGFSLDGQTGFGAGLSAHVTSRRTGLNGQFRIVGFELYSSSPRYARESKFSQAFLGLMLRCPKLTRVVYPELSKEGQDDLARALPNCQIDIEPIQYMRPPNGCHRTPVSSHLIAGHRSAEPSDG